MILFYVTIRSHSFHFKGKYAVHSSHWLISSLVYQLDYRVLKTDVLYLLYNMILHNEQQHTIDKGV